MGSFSIWHLLLILLIFLVVFGTKRLTSGAKDIGTAVKEFKKAMTDDPNAAKDDPNKTDPLHPALPSSNPDPSRPPPPADITRVERPPQSPGNDQRPQG